VQLGQRAWQENTDLAGLAGLRDTLVQPSSSSKKERSLQLQERFLS
jgi:hypothetical protein